MDIVARTRRSLEWDRLKEFLAAEADTASGKELSLLLEPRQETALVQELLRETDEAVSLIQARSPLSVQGLPDLREALSRLRAGADLSGKELLDIGSTLLICRAAKSSLSLLEPKTFPALAKFLPDLHVLSSLHDTIEVTLDEAGEVKDEASPELLSLRKDIRRIHGQIRDELTAIIQSTTLSKALQEPLFTQRNGRYVLPVNASSRHSIPGIVHDSSASGLTVYVEPMVVVELSNKARMKEASVEREISRLLHELSRQAGSFIEEIEATYRTLVELDCIVARARLSLRYGGVCPEISMEGKLDLRKARHPLLILQSPEAASHVVPNDIALGDRVRTMVVTGPNTGGKTVLLKTAGLLSLMTKAGLLLPVAPGSSIAIFKDVQADIGDEQSLEQSLSTFSSHMTNIVEIVRQATEGTLVLLDETGAGTDPKEGAALARAILEHLNGSGALTITTTHLGELKILAHTQSGFLNASLDFDEETLSPTYRLRVGVPGSSKATTIAARLGLNPEVVYNAESLLKEGSDDVQQLIEKLETKLKDLATREEEARKAYEESRLAEQQAKDQLKEVEEERERIRVDFTSRIEEEFKAAKDVLRQMIANLQRMPSSAGAEQARLQMETLRGQLDWIPVPKKTAAKSQLLPGQLVRVLSLNQKATIEKLPEDLKKPDSMVLVRSGNLKLKVPISDLEVISGSTQIQKSVGGPRQQKPDRRHSKKDAEYSLSVFVRTGSNTVDLRGQRVEAALSSLERFLDEAAVSKISPLMIIHGHGTGAVKSAVRQYLQASPYPNSFRPGEPYEGGDGVTIVELA